MIFSTSSLLIITDNSSLIDGGFSNSNSNAKSANLQVLSHTIILLSLLSTVIHYYI